MADFNPDASLYPQPAQAQQTNLLSNPQALLGAVGQINALKQFQARQAVGNAFQQGINPDGTLDFNKVASGLSNPQASLAAPEAIGALQDVRAKQIANNTASFSLAAGQNRSIQDAIGAWANDPNLTPQRVMNDVVSLSRRTDVPSDIYTSVLQTMPQNATPQQLHNWAANLGNVAMGTQAAASRVAGAVTPSGQQTQQSLGQSTLQPTGVATTNAPGTEQGAQAMQADLARASNFAQDMYPWQSALSEIQKLGPGGTGPGTQGREQMASFLYSLSPDISRWLGVDVSKVKDYEELNKYLTQAVQSRANAFGHTTDMQLATAASGSPGVHINNLANTDVIKSAIALKRMEAAQALESAKSGPVLYPFAKSQWATKQDPRAFMIDMMSPEQVQNLQKTLKGQARTRFNQSLQSAISSGVLQAPEQQ